MRQIAQTNLSVLIAGEAGIRKRIPRDALCEPCFNPLGPPVLGEEKETQRGFVSLHTLSRADDVQKEPMEPGVRRQLGVEGNG